LLEALEDLYSLCFISLPELTLMRQVTEKQLVVESLVRALQRYDAYYTTRHDRKYSVDWTDDKSVFPPGGKQRKRQ
jgi:hypothetical protein